MEPLKSVPESDLGRRSWDQPIDRVRLAKESDAVEHKSYRSHHLYEVAGNACTFKDCDFSYAVIERSYFRNALFENCRFIGAKILHSNFRSATFKNCDFQYTTIYRSNVPVAELLRNLPSFANVRRDFLQQLRANAVAMGDASHINQFVAVELDSERDYWREARKRTSAYYEKKYGTFGGRVQANWNSFRLALDRFVWGHGESVFRLVVSTLIAIVVLGLMRWVTARDGYLSDVRIGDLLSALTFTWVVYLDLPVVTDALNDHRLWGSCVLLLRYLSIGLFISVVFRKLSKR